MWQCVCVRVYVCMCVYVHVCGTCVGRRRLNPKTNFQAERTNCAKTTKLETREILLEAKVVSVVSKKRGLKGDWGWGQTPPSRTPWVEFGLNTMRVLLYIFKVSHWVQCGKWTGRGQKCKWRNQLRDCTPGKRRLWVRLRAVRWLLNYFQNTLWRAHFWEGH